MRAWESGLELQDPTVHNHGLTLTKFQTNSKSVMGINPFNPHLNPKETTIIIHIMGKET
jgi:hypothetical protein